MRDRVPGQLLEEPVQRFLFLQVFRLRQIRGDRQAHRTAAIDDREMTVARQDPQGRLSMSPRVAEEVPLRVEAGGLPGHDLLPQRDRGLSYMVVLFVVLVVVMDLAIRRTTWGRSVLAIGGTPMTWPGKISMLLSTSTYRPVAT